MADVIGASSELTRFPVADRPHGASTLANRLCRGFSARTPNNHTRRNPAKFPAFFPRIDDYSPFGERLPSSCGDRTSAFFRTVHGIAGDFYQEGVTFPVSMSWPPKHQVALSMRKDENRIWRAARNLWLTLISCHAAGASSKYVITDVSNLFLKAEVGGRPTFASGRFWISSKTSWPGFGPHSFYLCRIGCRPRHGVIRQCLRNIKRSWRSGVFLNCSSRQARPVGEMSFWFTEGWWKFRRLLICDGSSGAAGPQWVEVLAAERWRRAPVRGRRSCQRRPAPDHRRCPALAEVDSAAPEASVDRQVLAIPPGDG